VLAVGGNTYYADFSFLKISVFVGWVIGLISLGGNNIQKLRSASQEKIICFLFRMCDLHLKFLDLQTVLNWYIL